MGNSVRLSTHQPIYTQFKNLTSTQDFEKLHRFCKMKILMLVTMFAFVMAGLPTHAGGCANYNKVVLATFSENDFTISTCLTKCRTNTRCEGFALGKNRVTGKCILYKS